MKLSDIGLLLFPYRAHLESEIEYLRTQLAQRDRRLVELENRLIEAKPGIPVFREPKPVPINKPRGWEEYRRQRGQRSEEAGEEASQGVQAQVDKGVPV